MRIEQKLRELFALSLQIEGANFDHHPSAECVHVYRFIKGAVPSKYDVDINCHYGDWVLESNENHIDNAIKKAKQVIENQIVNQEILK